MHWYKGGDLGISPNITLDEEGKAGPSDPKSAAIIVGNNIAKAIYKIGKILSFGLLEKLFKRNTDFSGEKHEAPTEAWNVDKSQLTTPSANSTNDKESNSLTTKVDDDK